MDFHNVQYPIGQILPFDSYLSKWLLWIWKSLKICTLVKSYPFIKQARLPTTLRKKPFENIVGKGENAGNQHFLLFPQSFLSFPNQISIFE